MQAAVLRSDQSGYPELPPGIGNQFVPYSDYNYAGHNRNPKHHFAPHHKSRRDSVHRRPPSLSHRDSVHRVPPSTYGINSVDLVANPRVRSVPLRPVASNPLNAMPPYASHHNAYAVQPTSSLPAYESVYASSARRPSKKGSRKSRT
eukprot:Blabericola_migrator_1__187@NODE_104_length_14270_cov_182_757446_g92_i0_p9_GENE_NODE_104_length_14270_cov_182_757446_g92_i0NODE_104_length_14270_cov_182_757446_g92_i0_p9_ORF_typecomplete_len147_score2_77_NODE_104_length_14270_cov_182_757446_g92_i090899529